MAENHTEVATTPRQKSPEASRDLVSLLSRKVVGQSAATKKIVPYFYVCRSGLTPEKPAREGVLHLIKGQYRRASAATVSRQQSG